MYVLLIIAIYSDSCVEKTLIYYPHITKKCDICDMIQIETIFDILVKGFIIGVVVSAPLGPVGVLCIQRTLNKGRWYGFVTGLGASLSDIAYALLTGYGMSFVSVSYTHLTTCSRFYLFECSIPAGYLTHPPLQDIDTSVRHKLEETIRLEKAIFSYK